MEKREWGCKEFVKNFTSISDTRFGRTIRGVHAATHGEVRSHSHRFSARIGPDSRVRRPAPAPGSLPRAAWPAALRRRRFARVRSNAKRKSRSVACQAAQIRHSRGSGESLQRHHKRQRAQWRGRRHQSEQPVIERGTSDTTGTEVRRRTPEGVPASNHRSSPVAPLPGAMLVCSSRWCHSFLAQPSAIGCDTFGLTERPSRNMRKSCRLIALSSSRGALASPSHPKTETARQVSPAGGLKLFVFLA